MLTEDEIKRVVLETIGNLAPEVDVENIDPDLRLRNQINFDSIDFLNFALSLEEQLKVKIPEKDYTQLATLAGCIDYLKSNTD